MIISDCGNNISSMASTTVDPGWRQSGMLQGIGLPVPSGQHQVGCVDVMPLCKGDDSGLLFRLYYPTEATPDSGYQYTAWLPDNSYTTGFLLFKRLPHFVAGVLGPLTNMLLGNLSVVSSVQDILNRRSVHASTLWSTSEDIYSTASDSVFTWSGWNENSVLGCLL